MQIFPFNSKGILSPMSRGKYRVSRWSKRPNSCQYSLWTAPNIKNMGMVKQSSGSQKVVVKQSSGNSQSSGFCQIFRISFRFVDQNWNRKENPPNIMKTFFLITEVENCCNKILILFQVWTGKGRGRALYMSRINYCTLQGVSTQVYVLDTQ